jgi:LPXTG-site transpeptidase (sortase) family protein
MNTPDKPRNTVRRRSLPARVARSSSVENAARAAALLVLLAGMAIIGWGFFSSAASFSRLLRAAFAPSGAAAEVGPPPSLQALGQPAAASAGEDRGAANLPPDTDAVGFAPLHVPAEGVPASAPALDPSAQERAYPAPAGAPQAGQGAPILPVPLPYPVALPLVVQQEVAAPQEVAAAQAAAAPQEVAAPQEAAAAQDVAAQEVAAPQEVAAQEIAGAVPERIRIPRVGLDAPVTLAPLATIEIGGQTYTQWLAPYSFAAGWQEGTALAGAPGNTVLNGHHNIYGEVFGRLHELTQGDAVEVDSGGRTLHYTVRQVMILEERGLPMQQRLENARWVLPSQDARLTLVTCWPPESNTHRLIVVAAPADDK